MAKEKTQKKMGRPLKDFDKKAFCDLVGLGCTQEEICWYFRDENQKPANIDTLTRWCKREFGMTFQEFFKQSGLMYTKISLRRHQLDLSKKSSAMAIFLGKNYLGQTDTVTNQVQLVEDDPLSIAFKELSNVQQEAITDSSISE